MARARAALRDHDLPRLCQAAHALHGTTGRLHILRHTFCSRLAMRGATAKAIRELAGHVSLSSPASFPPHVGHRRRSTSLVWMNRAASLANVPEAFWISTQIGIFQAVVLSTGGQTGGGKCRYMASLL